LLEGLGHRVTIANARRVKLISASDNKTDEHDAELFARLGRADARLLAPMVHRSSELQADLAIAKARDTLVATRTKLVNHVRGTVKSFGERLPKCSSVSFVRHTRALVPAALETALAPVYETIAKLDEQIRAQDKMIAQTAERHPDVAVLEQVDGVGVLTALVYVLTLEDKPALTLVRSDLHPLIMLGSQDLANSGNRSGFARSAWRGGLAAVAVIFRPGPAIPRWQRMPYVPLCQTQYLWWRAHQIVRVSALARAAERSWLDLVNAEWDPLAVQSSVVQWPTAADSF
jgi:hypothetical protein